MKTTVETIINIRNCKYTFNGVNLANMRRTELVPLASALGIKGEMPKNEMLTRMLRILDLQGAEHELTLFSADQESASG